VLLKTLLARSYVLLVSLAPAWASAGFKIDPIPLVLDGSARTTEFRVTNTGKREATLQVEVARWSQGADGAEQQAPSGEVIVFPEMIRIPPGENRILRAGHPGGPAEEEKAFRIFLQELPVSSPGVTGIRTTFRFGIPLFVKPARGITDRSIERAWLKGGVVHAQVRNAGTTHVKVRRVTLRGRDAGGGEVLAGEARGWYVLPGARATFSVELPEEQCLAAQRLVVGAELADGSSMAPVALEVDAAECARPGAAGR